MTRWFKARRSSSVPVEQSARAPRVLSAFARGIVASLDSDDGEQWRMTYPLHSPAATVQLVYNPQIPGSAQCTLTATDWPDGILDVDIAPGKPLLTVDDRYAIAEAAFRFKRRREAALARPLVAHFESMAKGEKDGS